MEKSITGMVALLAGAFIANGQGLISFANYYNGPNYVTVEYNGQTVGGTAAHTGTFNDIHAGGDWTVQLYGAPGANQPLSSLMPVFGAPTAPPDSLVEATLAGVSQDRYLGQWNSEEIGEIPGAPEGTPATVAVAAWYNNGGTVTTLRQAQIYEFANGWSATGNVILEGAPNLPSPLPQLGNGIINITSGYVFGNVLIPEPGTITLGVMGASAFLMRFRKKQ